MRELKVSEREVFNIAQLYRELSPDEVTIKLVIRRLGHETFTSESVGLYMELMSDVRYVILKLVAEGRLQLNTNRTVSIAEDFKE